MVWFPLIQVPLSNNRAGYGVWVMSTILTKKAPAQLTTKYRAYRTKYIYLLTLSTLLVPAEDYLPVGILRPCGVYDMGLKLVSLYTCIMLKLTFDSQVYNGLEPAEVL